MKNLPLTLSKTDAEAIHRQIAEELPQTLAILVQTHRRLRCIKEQLPGETIRQAENLVNSGIALVRALHAHVEKTYPKAEWVNLYSPEVDHA